MRFLHTAALALCFAAPATAMELRGLLDRYVYTQNHPFAHLAVSVESGEWKGQALDVTVDDIAVTRFNLSDRQCGALVPLNNLTSGEHVLRAGSLVCPFRIEHTAPAQTQGAFTIRQTVAAPRDLPVWHVRTGVPFPEGALWHPENVSVVSTDGSPIPVQTRALATWGPQGSIRWLALDFQRPLKGGEYDAVQLRFGPDIRSRCAARITVEETDRMITVKTGAASFEIRKHGFNLIHSLNVAGRTVIAPGPRRGPYMTNAGGREFWAENDLQGSVLIEEQGPLRTVIRAEGRHVDGDAALGRYVVRMTFYSDLPWFALQHTFIITEEKSDARYADIGIAIPAAGSSATFGLEGDSVHEAAAPMTLLQRQADSFVIKLKNDQTVAQGEKAAGWFARGDLAVAVRDFWQNFPKELESTDGALIVHLWPAHGERVLSPQEEIRYDNAWRLPFVHHGRILDFTVPPTYTPEAILGDRVNRSTANYIKASSVAHALGLGKTHEMLVRFDGQPIRSVAEAFTAGVHYLSAPGWNCSTDGAGPIGLPDESKFPRPEEYVKTNFRWLLHATLEINQAYGMFNYGDSFTGMPSTDNHRPSYFRLWNGYHHGRPRLPWQIYLRSGDPQALAWARANTLHVIDIDTCHYALPQYEIGGDYGQQKKVGGMCDYKGFVHWHAGARSAEYNSMVDFIAWDYYLTGNGRAKDVLLEVGPLCVETADGKPERHGGGALGATFDYYVATWDPRALLRLQRELPGMYSKPAIIHEPSSVGWAPYLENYVAWTRDPAAERFLLQLADDVLDGRPGPGLRAYHFFGDGRALAMAHQLTGDDRYLRHAWGYYNALPTEQGTSWQRVSYDGQLWFALARQMNRRGSAPHMIDTTYRGFGPNYWPSTKARPATLTIQIPEYRDQAFEVHFRHEAAMEGQCALLDPTGNVIEVRDIPAGGHNLIFTRISDGITGNYTLNITCNGVVSLESVITTLGTHRFVLPLPDAGWFGKLNGRWFFFVPRNCESFSITFGGPPSAGRDPMTVEIIHPDDRTAQRIAGLQRGEQRVVTVKPRPEERGRIWSLNDGARIIDVAGIPRWFSNTPHGALPHAAD